MIISFVDARKISPRLFQKADNIVEGDIGDRDYLAKQLPGLILVFHQAAIRITQCAEEPRLALEVLADGTFNVLEAAVKAGVKR